MLLVIALLAAQTQDVLPVTRAKPRTATPWITNDDYPAAEARQHHEGTVGFALLVDESGRATKCDVTASSGYPGLDNGACFLLMRRARFDPARDASGRAVASTFPGRFTWHLGNAKPTRNGVDGTAGSEPPPAPGVLEVAVATLPASYKQPVKAQVGFGPNHRVRECTIEESSGNASVDSAACTQLRTLVVASPGSSADAAEYVVPFHVESAAKP